MDRELFSSISFEHIRTDRQSAASAFEELICQLGAIDPAYKENGRFFRIHGLGGDGGVEAIWRLNDGSVVGYQAKYFLKASEIDWRKVESSFTTALINYPNLTIFIVVMPCDLTGLTRGRKGGALGIWEEKVQQWEEKAKEAGRAVAIEFRGVHHLKMALQDERNAGLTTYWFNALILSQEWFERRLNQAITAMDQRYSPDDHVDVCVQSIQNLLSRAASLQDDTQKMILSVVDYAADCDNLVRLPMRWRGTIGDVVDDRIALVRALSRDISGLKLALPYGGEGQWPVGILKARLAEMIEAVNDLPLGPFQDVYARNDRATDKEDQSSSTIRKIRGAIERLLKTLGRAMDEAPASEDDPSLKSAEMSMEEMLASIRQTISEDGENPSGHEGTGQDPRKQDDKTSRSSAPSGEDDPSLKSVEMSMEEMLASIRQTTSEDGENLSGREGAGQDPRKQDVKTGRSSAPSGEHDPSIKSAEKSIEEILASIRQTISEDGENLSGREGTARDPRKQDVKTGSSSAPSGEDHPSIKSAEVSLEEILASIRKLPRDDEENLDYSLPKEDINKNNTNRSQNRIINFANGMGSKIKELWFSRFCRISSDYQQPAPPVCNNPSQPSGGPTNEEILASIRRIISEDSASDDPSSSSPQHQKSTPPPAEGVELATLDTPPMEEILEAVRRIINNDGASGDPSLSSPQPEKTVPPKPEAAKRTTPDHEPASVVGGAFADATDIESLFGSAEVYRREWWQVGRPVPPIPSGFGYSLRAPVLGPKLTSEPQRWLENSDRGLDKTFADSDAQTVSVAELKALIARIHQYAANKLSALDRADTGSGSNPTQEPSGEIWRRLKRPIQRDDPLLLDPQRLLDGRVRWVAASPPGRRFNGVTAKMIGASRNCAPEIVSPRTAQQPPSQSSRVGTEEEDASPPQNEKQLAVNDEKARLESELKDVKRIENAVDGLQRNVSQVQDMRRRLEVEDAFSFEEKRVILVTGQAGAGKSHLLTHIARWAHADGAPAILLLGQYFSSGDPWTEILTRIGLPNATYSAFLGALNAAAKSRKKRALLIIDGINEGGGGRVWMPALGAFLNEVRQHDSLAVVLSCRDVYLKSVIPKLKETGYLAVECSGFSTLEEQEAAARQYLDKRGIERPALPWLSPEFINPLFLRSCCDALKQQKRTRFPRGLRGVKQTVGFYFDSIAQSLASTYPDVDDLPHCLVLAVQALAGEMARRQADFVPSTQARVIVETAFNRTAPAGSSWADLLRLNGILRRDEDTRDHDVETQQSSPSQFVYRFTFQRFSDYLIAEKLCDGVDSFGDAFRFQPTPGPLAFLLEPPEKQLRIADAWIGVFSAACIVVAEKKQQELLANFSPFQIKRLANSNPKVLRECLVGRSTEAVLTDTTMILNMLLDDTDTANLGFEILTQLAVVGEHPWNAWFLHQRLRSATLGDRDRAWTCYVLDSLADSSGIIDDSTRLSVSSGSRIAIRLLVDWCGKGAIAGAHPDTLLLSSVVLAWCLALPECQALSAVRAALLRVLTVRPFIWAELVKLFESVEDPWVNEKLFSLGFALTCSTRDKATLHQIADVVQARLARPSHGWIDAPVRRLAHRILGNIAWRTRGQILRADDAVEDKGADWLSGLLPHLVAAPADDGIGNPGDNQHPGRGVGPMWSTSGAVAALRSFVGVIFGKNAGATAQALLDHQKNKANSGAKALNATMTVENLSAVLPGLIFPQIGRRLAELRDVPAAALAAGAAAAELLETFAVALDRDGSDRGKYLRLLALMINNRLPSTSILGLVPIFRGSIEEQARNVYVTNQIFTFWRALIGEVERRMIEKMSDDELITYAQSVVPILFPGRISPPSGLGHKASPKDLNEVVQLAELAAVGIMDMGGRARWSQVGLVVRVRAIHTWLEEKDAPIKRLFEAKLKSLCLAALVEHLNAREPCNVCYRRPNIGGPDPTLLQRASAPLPAPAPTAGVQGCKEIADWAARAVRKSLQSLYGVDRNLIAKPLTSLDRKALTVTHPDYGTWTVLHGHTPYFDSDFERSRVTIHSIFIPEDIADLAADYTRRQTLPWVISEFEPVDVEQKACYGEFPWSERWAADEWQRGQVDVLPNCLFHRPVQRFHWKRGFREPVKRCLPSRWLGLQMGAWPMGEDVGGLVDRSGDVVFLDVFPGQLDPVLVLARTGPLARVLSDNRLTCLWSIEPDGSGSDWNHNGRFQVLYGQP